VELEGFHLYVIHDVNALDLNPKAAGFVAVISGHSHKPAQATKDGVLYFNPGSAGPRRFSLPVSIGRLEIEQGGIRGSLHTLGIR
jgi:predicted phosphodiesterase